MDKDTKEFMEKVIEKWDALQGSLEELRNTMNSAQLSDASSILKDVKEALESPRGFSPLEKAWLAKGYVEGLDEGDFVELCDKIGRELPEDATEAEIKDAAGDEPSKVGDEATVETAEVSDEEPEMIKGKTDKEGYDYLPNIDYSVKKKLEE